MSIGESKGGLPPDSLCEDEDAILADSQRVVETFTMPTVMPCSVWRSPPVRPSVSMDLMRESATLHVICVGLHTHLAENIEDIDYSLATRMPW